MKKFSREKIALVIGNSNYYNVGTLRNPGNDATSMNDVLKKLGFDVSTLLDLEQRSFHQKIDNFGKEIEDYRVRLFFYAGHGIQYNGINHLVPVDACINDENQIDSSCINLNRVLKYLERESDAVNVVILDACRNNPFQTSLRNISNSGLAYVNAPCGTLIAYATAPGMTASDGTNANGLYTGTLLNQLLTPNITIIQMLQRVRVIVKEKSDGKQIPWESTSLTDDLYISNGANLKLSDNKISEINNYRLSVDSTSYSFDKFEKDTYESTEGGVLEFFVKGDQLFKVGAIYYGEMGQARYDYYYRNNELCFCSVITVNYNRPIYWDKELSTEFNDCDVFDFSKSNFSERRFFFEKGKLIALIDEFNNLVMSIDEDEYDHILEAAQNYLGIAFNA